MPDFYLKSGAGAVPRTNSAVVALGAKIVIDRADVTANYLVVRKWVLECTTAGTTDAAVPVWPATVTQDTTTVTDGTAVFTFRKPGFSSGTTAAWTFSAIYMDYVASAMAAGDRLFVSNNHSETTAVAITITFPGTLASPTQVICGVDTVIPPTAPATTAIVATTGTSSMIIQGAAVYVYGVTFNVGSGAGNPIFAYSTVGRLALVNCAINCVASDADIFIGQSAAGRAVLILKNTLATFAGTTKGIIVSGGELIWEGGGVTSGSAITTLLKAASGNNRGSAAKLSGLNLTGCGAGVALFVGGGSAPFDWAARNCQLPALWTGTLRSGTLNPVQRFSMHNCDSGDTNYRTWVEDDTGSIRSETVIVRTGGASDGTTPLSHNMTSSANAEYPLLLLISDEIFSEWIETVGVAKTITVEIIHDSLTALTDAEVWLEIQHLGTVGFPLGVFANDAKASVLATAANQTASTVAWTTTGLTNPNKQKLEVTFTPQEKGVVICRVVVAKASYTVYVDPLATIT